MALLDKGYAVTWENILKLLPHFTKGTFNFQNMDGVTVMHRLLPLVHRWKELESSVYEQVFNHILDSGFDVNLQNKWGTTLLADAGIIGMLRFDFDSKQREV